MYINYIQGSFIIYKTKFFVISHSLSINDKLQIFNNVVNKIYINKKCPVTFVDVQEHLLAINNPEIVEQFLLTFFQDLEKKLLVQLQDKLAQKTGEG